MRPILATAKCEAAGFCGLASERRRDNSLVTIISAIGQLQKMSRKSCRSHRSDATSISRHSQATKQGAWQHVPAKSAGSDYAQTAVRNSACKATDLELASQDRGAS